MLKKIIRLVLCLIIPIAMMTGCNAPKKVSKPTHQETVSIDVNGAYTTKHDVALYLHTYHKLPKNFHLPTNQSYHECDIETMHQESRGTKRLVYSNNFDIYYTEDHYNTFIKVYSGEGQ